MKRLILFIPFLLLLFITPVFGVVDKKDGVDFTTTSDVDGFTSNIDDYDGQVVTAAGGCVTSQNEEIGAQDSSSDICEGTANRQWWATQFVATASYTICKADVYLSKTGTPAFNVTVSIYTDSSGEPGTLIGTASDARAGTSLTSSEAAETFVNMSAAVTDTSTYWVVINGSTAGGVSDYITWFLDNGGVTEDMDKSADGSSWASATIIYTGKYTLYN